MEGTKTEIATVQDAGGGLRALETCRSEIPTRLRDVVVPATRCPECDDCIRGIESDQRCPKCGCADASAALEFPVSIARKRVLRTTLILAIPIGIATVFLLRNAYEVGGILFASAGAAILVWQAWRQFYLSCSTAIWPARCILTHERMIVRDKRSVWEIDWDDIVDIETKAGSIRFPRILVEWPAYRCGATTTHAIPVDGDLVKNESLARFLLHCRDRLARCD